MLFDSGKSTTASFVNVAVYFNVNSTSPLAKASLIALIVASSLITTSNPKSDSVFVLGAVIVTVVSSAAPFAL